MISAMPPAYFITVADFESKTPSTAKLQAQVKTLITPSRKTAASATIPAWSELKTE